MLVQDYPTAAPTRHPPAGTRKWYLTGDRGPQAITSDAGLIRLAMAVVTTAVADLGPAVTRPMARRFLLETFSSSLWADILAAADIGLRPEQVASMVATRCRRRATPTPPR